MPMKRILVTTIKRGAVPEQSGNAYLFDLDTKKMVAQCGMLPFKSRFPRNTRGGIRGLRGAFINKDTQKIYVASNDTITVLGFDLQPKYTIDSTLFSNLHGIKGFRKGFLVASCGNDSILYVDEETHETNVVINFMGGIDPNHNYNLVDRHGVLRPNSIGVFNDDTFYVVFANRGSVVMVSNVGTEQVTTDIPTRANVPHNLVFSKKPEHNADSFYYCSSKDSRLYFSPSALEQDIVLLRDPRPWWFHNSDAIRWGWLRGLFVSGDQQIVVGSSPYARVLTAYHTGTHTNHKTREYRLSRNKYEVVFSVVPFPEDWV